MSEIKLTVHPFRMGTDKEAAVKMLEETVEAYGIWDAISKQDCDPELLSFLSYELADVIQAVCNLADRYDIDLTASMGHCGCISGNAVERKGYSPRENVDGRFISYYGSDNFRTVVDSKTGITYLVWERPSGKSMVGGITPLLDRDGKPVISEEVSE